MSDVPRGGRSPAEDEGDPWAWATGAVRRVVGHGGEEQVGTRRGWATGSVECCVCPVCRMITTMRSPAPEAAERLATGAGDFATGVASLMRAFSIVQATRPKPKPKPKPKRPAAPPSPPDPDLAWSAATRRAAPADVPEPHDENESPWTAATRTANREAAEREAAARAERERAAKEKADQDRRARQAAAAARREATARRQAAAADATNKGEGPAGGGAEGGSASGGRNTADDGNAATGDARGDGDAAGGRAGESDGTAGGGTGAGRGRRDEARSPWGWSGGDRAGDVWARATADPGVGGSTSVPTVDHDGVGDAARE